MTSKILNMINSKEQELLNALRADARISISDLSRRLNLSRTTVQSRLNKLEQSGVIKGYVVELGDEYAESLISAHVAIKVKPHLNSATSVKLKNLDNIYELMAISGEYDLIAVVKSNSLPSLNHMLDKIGNLEGVERTNSSIILETKFKK